MPTPHITAASGEIAPLVLMPGDPKRAQRIARDFLSYTKLVSDVRGIMAYTGTYKGTPMSVMASGMGIPSLCIYANELYDGYGVQRIIRVGTAGAIAPAVKVRDVVIATAAHTDSSVPQVFCPGVNLSLAPSYALLRGLVDAAKASGANVHVGPVFTSDHFYSDRPAMVDGLERLGTLAVEMESAGLFATALRHDREAATVLTVSDHLRDHSHDMTAEERESSFAAMVQMAAEALVS